MDILAFSVQEKEQCVSWYIRTNFAITVRWDFYETWKNPPALRKILKLIENFNCQGNVGNATRCGRPSVSEQRLQTSSTYFHMHPQRRLRRVVICLSILYCTIPKVLKRQIHMFPYNIRKFHDLGPQEYTQRLTFVQSCMEKYLLNPAFYVQ